MQTHIDATLEADPALATAVREAGPILESVVGSRVEQPRAEWGLERDALDRSRIILRLSDATGEVIGRFTPQELAEPEPLKIRLYDLWGDLLQIRSHRQLEQLQAYLDKIGRMGVGQN